MSLQTFQLQKFYLLAAICGIAATWYFNILFMLEHGGFSLGLYLTENYVNYASASISNDILVVALVFFVWSFNEAKKLGMKNWWLYVLLTFGVAIAFALPLFLYMRERKMACKNDK